ncbi:MAG TPA: CPBP family glutamic-type intramembrane protease [Streptosporangiaceae bacterium]
MALSVTLEPPARAARPRRLALGAAAFAAALGAAEATVHLAGPFWGAIGFAVVFLATVHLAILVGTRRPAERQLMALVAVASLVPLERLLVLSVPTLPALRLYPNALWVVPMSLASAYAYGASWIPGPRTPLVRPPIPGRRPLALQAAVAAAGAGLGALAAFTIPYSGPQVLVYPDAAKWIGAALFTLAGVAEELAWRGVLQRFAADAFGQIGIAFCFVASAYLAVAWMGPSTAAPVIVLSGLSSVVVYRTRCLSGAVTGHFLLNLLLVLLR